jgi:hypothetical protein
MHKNFYAQTQACIWSQYTSFYDPDGRFLWQKRQVPMIQMVGFWCHRTCRLVIETCRLSDRNLSSSHINFMSESYNPAEKTWLDGRTHWSAEKHGSMAVHSGILDHPVVRKRNYRMASTSGSQTTTLQGCISPETIKSTGTKGQT